ncbi:MAG: hypothetical protein ACHP6H_00295 [Legionellales bacterium]
MTIFLMVLQKLLDKELSTMSSQLGVKAQSVLTNHKLSRAQQVIVDDLKMSILQDRGTGDDREDHLAIIKKIDTARLKLEETRELHNQAREEGDTIKCFTKLRYNTAKFHTKLEDNDFKLLNIRNVYTPECLLYYESAYYFGREIFNPLVPNQKEVGSVRKAKETSLQERLEILSKLIKPTSDYAERCKRTCQALTDIATDNGVVITSKRKMVNAPGLSFLGMQVTVPNGPGEGRLKELITTVRDHIKTMTLETYNPEGPAKEGPIRSDASISGKMPSHDLNEGAEEDDEEDDNLRIASSSSNTRSMPKEVDNDDDDDDDDDDVVVGTPPPVAAKFRAVPVPPIKPAKIVKAEDREEERSHRSFSKN